MSGNRDSIRSFVVSMLPGTWIIVSIALMMIFYQVFSLSNWFFQVGSGIFISFFVIAVYVVLMVKLDDK